MKAAIFLNPDGVNLNTLEKIKDKLICEDITPILYQENMSLDEFDFCIAFGGDGTILQAAKKAAGFHKSVLGINGGNLGYTAGLETSELCLLSNLKSGRYNVDKRMMFEVCVFKDNKCEKHYCVNDAVISKGALSRIIDISVCVSGKDILDISSDGIIVSTPTGSTAYSLSAGGPILDPSINSILVTSICPHSFFGRPIVLNEDETVEISVNPKKNSEAFLTIDGDVSVKLCEGDRVTVKKAGSITANLIRIKNESFMQILHNKFQGRR